MSAGQVSITFFPWQGTKSTVGTWARANVNTFLGMGYIASSGAQNDEATWDTWLDGGTWKIALVHTQDTNRGIYNLQLNGASQGTIDGYAAATTANVYSELTGLSVSTGLKTLKMLMATKNASASSYFATPQSIALIKTAGAHTSGGTDTPGYTVEIIPWAGSKANTTFATRVQASGDLGGGRLETDTTAQNNSFTDDIYLDNGTYKVAVLTLTNNNAGIYNITGINGTQTVDCYAASGVFNVYIEVTGVVVTVGVKSMQVQMATKNASSSAYKGDINSLSWVRTGA